MAGLLDGYQFDPQSYGGAGPGWLGSLLGSMQQQGQGQGFPQDQSQLPPSAQPTAGVTLPQQAADGFGKDGGASNPLLSMLGGIGGGLSSMFSPGQAQAQPQAPQQAGQPQPPAAPEGPGLLDRLSAGAGNFTTGGNPIAGLLNSIKGITTGQRTDAAGIQQQQLNSTYHALVASGVQPALAQAAALNPHVMAAIAPEFFGGSKVVQTGEGAFGDKQFMVQGPGGTFRPIPGTDQAGGAAPGGGGSYLAPGVRQINSQLAGDDYLKQFSPELQAAVKDYVDGKSMPTGNPRKGFTQAVKMIAQKYGQDIGTPSDDTTFNARSQMRKNLSTAAPNSLGGQINIGNTAIGHLDDLSRKALDLGNVDVGIAPLSHVINDVRGMTSAQAAKMEALQGAAQHYGQEITKFYAGSPGGEAERNRFMSAVSGAKTPQELAAVIETEAELAHSRIQALDSQIRGTLGDAGAAQYPVVRPETQKSMERISANVQRLRGGGGAQAAAPTAAPDRAALEAEARRRGLIK